MKCNVGSIDRVIRIVIGLIIAIAGIIFKSYWGIVGIVIMATGVFGYCALYSLLNINTKKKIS
ncbi:MAG TPA: DUF2892 domain-containing protein [Prolixibacteraceae bacterium]|nr:DUF2892 domain-containing protein [Prolixibacteraceae bacterium]